MALKIGEQTMRGREQEAELEVRRLSAAYNVADKKCQDCSDPAQQEKLLAAAREIRRQLDEACETQRWIRRQIAACRHK